MKSAKGFRGKYFSLAAILALSTTMSLASQSSSIESSSEIANTQSEYSEDEEQTPPVEELGVVVVSKQIKVKKSKIYSASKNYVSTTNMTDNVSILTAEEIKLSGYTTLTQALDSLPGISFTSSGGYGKQTNLYLQGMSNKYTLVMIDGVKYNDPSNTDGVRLEFLMLDNVERIEVIKGAQSGVWGADAVAGVVNIITKKAQKPGSSAAVSLEAGSYGARSANVSLSHRTRDYDVLASILRKTTDGFTVAADKYDDIDIYEDDAYRNTTLNLKLGYWINPDNRLEAGYSDTNSFVYYDSGAGASNANTDQKADYRAKSGFLKYKYFLGKHVIETTLNQSYFRNYNYGYTTKYRGENSSLELKDSYKYGEDNFLVFGGSLDNRDVRYESTTKTIDKNDKNKALFLNNTNRVNNVILTQALRYDYFSAFDDKITGKLGVKYLIDTDVDIYANAGTGYLAPSILQIINPFGTDNFNLHPEKSKSINIGLRYSQLQINIFRNEIKDMISWSGGQYDNLPGTSVFKGVEVSYQKAVMDNLLLGLDYSYVSANDKNKKRIKKVPKYQVGINATYALASNINLYANGTYVGSRAETDFATSSDVDTGRYFAANTKIDYRVNKTLNTYFKIDNLFDREYQTTFGYATPRRSYYLGLEARF